MSQESPAATDSQPRVTLSTGVALSTRVALSKRIAYALPALALAVVGIPLYVYMPKFYADVVGVDVGLIGVLLLAARLFDAVSDPFIGILSDRTRTRFGRRRPWLALGVVPLAIALVALFAPPADLAADAAALWFGIGLFGVFLLWTIVAVPYESLGPEISFDYDERTSILALRDGLLIVGTVLAAASPLIATTVADLGAGAEAEREKFRLIAWFYAPVLIVCCFLCAAVVREQPRQHADAPPGNWFAMVGGLFGNRPFVILLASYTVTALGSNLPATLIPFYVQYVLGDPDSEAYLLLYFVTGIALLPLWVYLARRFDKKWAWIASGALNSGSFACVFFLGPGDVVAYAILVAVSGIGFGATLALPSAMQADVIDYEELRTGRRREGEIIGVWLVARKLAAAIGVGLALPVLGLAGYVPNVEQTETVRLTLSALYALVPALLTLLGLALAFAYPIDRRRHAAIMAAIAARGRGETVADPLAV